MAKRRSDNKTFEQLKAVVSADQDQDIENAKAWCLDSGVFDVMQVWAACQQSYEDPVMECMSRFATIGMTHVLQRINFGEDETDPPTTHAATDAEGQ